MTETTLAAIVAVTTWLSPQPQHSAGLLGNLMRDAAGNPLQLVASTRVSVYETLAQAGDYQDRLVIDPSGPARRRNVWSQRVVRDG